MKLLRTLILFDKGGLAKTEDWRSIYRGVKQAIKSIDHPTGTGKLVLRRKKRLKNNQWRRNGVGYLKRRFFHHLVTVQGWSPEVRVADITPKATKVVLYPSSKSHIETITSEFGGLDFESKTKTGMRIAVEWETGNISSSHRSMNKLALAVSDGALDFAVLIVPSRRLYEHLTDRVGNISELSAYLRLWKTIGTLTRRGLLAIAVVEHDKLANNGIPYLKAGKDGMSRKKKVVRKVANPIRLRRR